MIARYHDIPLQLMTELREMPVGEREGLALPKIQRRFSKAFRIRQNDRIGYGIPVQGESIGILTGELPVAARPFSRSKRMGT